MNKNYCDSKSILLLISLLKQNNIKKVIASPGTTNLGFVASIKRDPYFEVYSCVDERAACYMAGGLAVDCQEPVVITCTGATASRNYFPGLTEAYYRKIPILAITFAPPIGNIGRNVPQAIDRRTQPSDSVKLSVQIPLINSKDDEYSANLLLNKAILELTHKGGGPVHINIVYDNEGLNSFNTKELPNVRVIRRYDYEKEFPIIDANKRIGIFIGAHKGIDLELEKSIDDFCQKYNSVVLYDHTSNYNGKYGVIPSIILDQDNYKTELNNFDILIYIGEVSGAYLNINSKETWRVNEDGELKDVYKNMTKVFEVSENYFFSYYAKSVSTTKNTSQYNNWKTLRNELVNCIDENNIPLSNIYTAYKMISKVPSNSVVHLGILNTLRSWNYFEISKGIKYVSNTGGFGIDGFTSTLIGASLNKTNNIYFGILGDLAFFYDLNSLGNINVKNNIRILLINNGGGTEFHNYSHPASVFEQDVAKYIAADGHFGNKSKSLVRDLAGNFGFEYLSASTKEEFDKEIDYFTSSEEYEKPIIFEVFTNSEEESNALKYIRNLKKNPKEELKNNIKKIMPQRIKKMAKKVLKG